MQKWGVELRAIIQRVTQARVSLKNDAGTLREINAIGKGIVVLVGVGKEDTEENAAYLAEKISNLRIFPDQNGKMNLSVLEAKGEVLIISQFTLYGDCKKGRRPDFASAAPPEMAKELYRKFIQYIQTRGITVKSGEFQAHMIVEIHNDGPVTIFLEG